ncbi:hypothetical protein HKX48_001287 [Thoreauomyces humboldtii]|nr:hypothetical protein HKX48_001287 [Thoreauomyces humboldtii]
MTEAFLPIELINVVFSHLSLREQAAAAQTCSRWSRAFGQMEALSLTIGRNLAGPGAASRVIAKFRKLKLLEIVPCSSTPASIIRFAEQLPVMPTLTHLHLETTAAVSKILDRNVTPRLTHLTLVEAITAPCSHLYRSPAASILQTVFGRGLERIDLNIPLAMAAEGWDETDWDGPNGQDMQDADRDCKELAVRSLHVDSLKTLIKHFIGRRPFPNLEVLELHSEEAVLSRDEIEIIRQHCPALRELVLTGIWIDVDGLVTFARDLRGLTRLRLVGCDIPWLATGAEGVVRCLMHLLPGLKRLELIHNRPRDVLGPYAESMFLHPVSANPTLTTLVLLGCETPTNGVLPVISAAALEVLRIDNLAPDDTILSSLPRTLRQLDLKFKQQSIRSDSGYATPVSQQLQNPPSNLISVTLHNPPLHLLASIVAHASGVRTLDLQHLSADAPPLLVPALRSTLKGITSLTVHAHGAHSVNTVLAYLKVFNRSSLRVVKLNATHPFFEATTADSPPELPIPDLSPNLHTLTIKGLTPRFTHLPSTLTILSLPTLTIPTTLPLHPLRRLRRLTLIAPVPLAVPDGDGGETPEARTVSALHAAHGTLCERYATALWADMPWLDACVIRADDVRRAWLRRWVVGRVNRRIGELTGGAHG